MLPLMPQPRRVRIGSGSFFPLRDPGTVCRCDPASARDPSVRTLARAIRLRVVPDPGLPPACAVVGTMDGLGDLPPDHAEGYSLTATEGGVVVRASQVLGLFRGLTTLRQLWEHPSALPSLGISDWPEYAARCHHDDISRKQVSTVADFKRIVRLLSHFKISHYTPYIEDMLEVEGIPLMGAGRGALTVDEVREVVAEGRLWQVEVFPTLSLAGHQENLLRLPPYRSMGSPSWQPPSALNPHHPQVRPHLIRVIEAACAAFPGPFFHVAFDEIIGWQEEDFVYHLNWCAEELTRRGKTPFFWADMLYNHFGCDLLARLHPALIPVSWGYDAEQTEEKQAPALHQCLQFRPRAAVLAGYNNWCSFFRPATAEMLPQWRMWRRHSPPSRIALFGSSQWGDDGYENHRDLAWPLFAAFGEQLWSGDDADPDLGEVRFHQCFYGHPLPGLVEINTLLQQGLSISPRRAWSLHRLPAPGWKRLAAAGKLPEVQVLRKDLLALDGARERLAQCRREAVREAGHLNQVEVAILRMTSVLERGLAAWGALAGEAVRAGLKRARSAYARAWKQNNRPENLGVSLRVFDRQAESWGALGKRVSHRSLRRYRPIDPGPFWNRMEPGVGGVPVGLTEIDGIPFHFAPVDQTHLEVPAGSTLELPLPGLALRDLHLVMTQARRGTDPTPAARLQLFRGTRLLYEEDLLAIRHLCDWWAPLGEHMWAGGGLAYTDPMRVRYLLSPAAPYGLTCIHRFPWPGSPSPDRVVISCLDGSPLQFFALTVELEAS